MTEEFSLLSYLNVTVPDKVPVVKLSSQVQTSKRNSDQPKLEKKIFTPMKKPPASNYCSSESDFGLGRDSRAPSISSNTSSQTPIHAPIQRKTPNPHYETTYRRTYTPMKIDTRRPEDVSAVVKEMDSLFDDESVSVISQTEAPAFESQIENSANQEGDFRPPFMSPAHRRRTVSPSATFLNQSIGLPQEVRVSEVRVSQPGCDPIIYEVHDLELPPSAEELNAENDRIKMEHRKLIEEEDRLYSLGMNRDNEAYFNEQKAVLEAKKRMNQQEYEDWKQQVQSKKERELLDKMQEEDEVRRIFAADNDNARKMYEDTLNAKAKEAEKYNQILQEQILEKERQRQAERALDLQPVGDYDNTEDLARIQERLNRRKELLSFWEQQIENKERNLQEEKSLERKLFSEAFERDMRELQDEYSRTHQAKEDLKNEMNTEWKKSVERQQQRKMQAEEEKDREQEWRKLQDNQILAEQQMMLEERARRIQERKRGLDEQLARINAYKTEERLQNESVEQEMLRKIREGLMRRKLYRDIRTKRILSGKEAKRIVPSSQYDN